MHRFQVFFHFLSYSPPQTVRVVQSNLEYHKKGGHFQLDSILYFGYSITQKDGTLTIYFYVPSIN
jgi:hypothetical protein